VVLCMSLKKKRFRGLAQNYPAMYKRTIPIMQHTLFLATQDHNSTRYISRMDTGYWQPVAQCKNPECFSGKPTFLPFPNLPTIEEAQPEWPVDDWKPFLICMHCGRGYNYSKDDVEWISANNKHGLREHHLIQFVELACAEKSCSLPIKVYLRLDDTISEKERIKLLETGSKGSACESGHPPAKPLHIFRSIFVSAIRRYRPSLVQAK
jgi:hypothetical protein